MVVVGIGYILQLGITIGILLYSIFIIARLTAIFGWIKTLVLKPQMSQMLIVVLLLLSMGLLIFLVMEHRLEMDDTM